MIPEPDEQVREFNHLLERIQQKRVDKNKTTCYHYDSIIAQEVDHGTDTGSGLR